jgi:hypothetical protein
MNKLIAGASLAAIALCLSACDSQQETPSTIRMAEGEILERSVSDDILPYDRLTSQPPLEQPEGRESSGAVQPDDAASDTPPAEPAAPGP